MHDVPLFDLPPSVPVRTSKQPTNAGRSVWTRYNPRNRVPCDECMQLLHEADGKGFAANSARWRLNADGVVTLLCLQHAEVRRKEG